MTIQQSLNIILKNIQSKNKDMTMNTSLIETNSGNSGNKLIETTIIYNKNLYKRQYGT